MCVQVSKQGKGTDMRAGAYGDGAELQRADNKGTAEVGLRLDQQSMRSCKEIGRGNQRL